MQGCRVLPGGLARLRLSDGLPPFVRLQQCLGIWSRKAALNYDSAFYSTATAATDPTLIRSFAIIGG